MQTPRSLFRRLIGMLAFKQISSRYVHLFVMVVFIVIIHVSVHGAHKMVCPSLMVDFNHPGQPKLGVLRGLVVNMAGT